VQILVTVGILVGMDKPPVRFDDPDEVGRMVEAFNALELAKAELAKAELAKAADSHPHP
jgi:hypothetical protein